MTRKGYIRISFPPLQVLLQSNPRRRCFPQMFLWCFGPSETTKTCRRSALGDRCVRRWVWAQASGDEEDQDDEELMRQLTRASGKSLVDLTALSRPPEGREGGREEEARSVSPELRVCTRSASFHPRGSKEMQAIAAAKRGKPCLSFCLPRRHCGSLWSRFAAPTPPSAS